MQAKTIRERGGYNDRTLRYVVEQRMIPGLDSPGTGTFRDYSAKQAFLVALACELREEGFHGEVVKTVVEFFHANREWKEDGEVTLTFGKLGAIRLTVDPGKIRRKLRITW